MTGVSECSQQRGNLKDNGYNPHENTPISLIWQIKTQLIKTSRFNK
ncbi:MULTISPECIES: hypothetical protein [Photorhabdus]|uniref:Uncharacterized protein n=2 Tax=Photorhabdus TaxID=29487 RepID=A0ABX0B0C5_9GAMM|nr:MULTISPECIES: hypothetical protein [Photorhabdus]MCT8353342.1 hypothetical protein [Photorhabdus kayaii]MDB6366149.1 hypothetical protein [Photorhabdus bodei]MDB6370771.1 hypothetical protein [Photorhabdus bodei]NDL10758.1 hypothetical protein [Photorhabdus kayaii]NDL24224.1 hypothetical protein [Photorhabdus kayaii]